MRRKRPLASITPTIVEVEITALASGGDGVAREAGGRVVFVPLTAPGDRVRARLVEAKPSFARGEVVEVVTPGAARVEPRCPEVARGCGGCQWQQVSHREQARAKQLIVANALRKVAVTIHPLAEPCPPLGWRRRARFHVEGGHVGLYARSSHRVLALRSCPQLEPALDAALAVLAEARPPDGELTMLLGHTGAIVVGTEHMWPGAGQVVGKANIVGAVTGPGTWGTPAIEVEPGLINGPADFAQASAAGNAALIALTRAALGSPGDQRSLVELYAGHGNFTRTFVADGWDVIASDLSEPRARDGVRFEVGLTQDVLARLSGPVEAVVLDPPRAGAIEAIDGIARLSPNTIVYVSCDPATLARDAVKLVERGYRATDAWPIDLMPQTAHVEVVLRFVKTSERSASS